ncbi:MAG: hypothetical protein R3F37_13300 [Candidatus Competibacteraceae bacterium]
MSETQCQILILGAKHSTFAINFENPQGFQQLVQNTYAFSLTYKLLFDCLILKVKQNSSTKKQSNPVGLVDQRFRINPTLRAALPLLEKQAVRGWLKGFDHQVLLVGRVFTNRDGSTGRLNPVCSDRRAKANRSWNDSRSNYPRIKQIQCGLGQITHADTPHPTQLQVPEHPKPS